MLWISPLNSNESYTVEAHEINKTIVNVPALHQPWLKSFTHLSDIDFPHKDGPIDVILGVQYSHLHAENEIGPGRPFEPVAKRTRLGWHVIGPDNTRPTPNCPLNFVSKIKPKRWESEHPNVRVL